MKKLLSIITASIIMMLLADLNAQTFESRVFENELGYLVYQMRETSGTGTPTTTTIVNDITFVIRYPSGSVDIGLICSSNAYNIIDGLSGEQTFGGYDYHYWNAGTTPLNPPNNWTQNVWEDIVTFEASGATGSGLFEVAPDGWDGRSLNWNQGNPPVDYTPSVNGSVTYSYPTLVYDFVWVGGGTGPGADPEYWNQTNNWENECGDAPSTGFWPYQSTENVYIPDVSGESNYFPGTFKVSEGYAYNCNNLLIASGAHISVPDLSTNTGTFTYFNIAGDCKINGTLYLSPDGHATVGGATTINSAGGVTVQATSAGAGSFIDNGTIGYGASGTAKVQTYLSNAAGSGSFYIHQVGPTVDEENYTGSGTGAYLSAFNVSPGNTYAYSWDETQPTVDGWQNISSNTYEVNTADGIALSTTDASNHTLNMTGALMTGNISSPALTYTNNHNELISNPYPSSVNFDALATANSSVVANKYWIWDPSAGNYVARAGGAGGSQYVQVGQGFFVETISGGTFDFTNTERAHSNDPFRDYIANLLTVETYGGDYGFRDELIIRFNEDATFGYDIEIEAEKWKSRYEDATSFMSTAEDSTELAINVLPIESLDGDMVSVPVKFQCGYVGEYTFSFYDLESFESGVEVWLEDKQTGDDWISINNNPDYTFTASPDDFKDRFIIHFFGPTGVDEFAYLKTVRIYSSGNNAYVVNNTDEHIKNVLIYNLSGELMINEKVPDQKINKLWVSNKLGYYIVKVVTDKNIYLEKVMITYY